MVITDNGRIPSTEEKSSRQYGAKIAQRMWNGYKHGGLAVGYNSAASDAELDALAQGRMSQGDITESNQFLGAKYNETLGSLGFKKLEIQHVNILPKYINIMQDKLCSIRYDIGVDAIDPVALDEKKELEKAMMAYVRLKDHFAKIGVTFEKIKEEFGIDEMPDTSEDVRMLLNTSYKNYDAMRGEIELLKFHSLNDWDEAIKPKVAWDLLVRGVSCVRTYMDQYGEYREEWVPMNRFVCSWSPVEDFPNLQYAGHIEYLTLDEFICDTKGHLSVDEAFRVFEKHKGTYLGTGEESTWYGKINTDAEARIKVFRFQYLTEEIEKYTLEVDQLGNPISKKRKPGFTIPLKEKMLYDSGIKELVEVAEGAKYGGNWVVGSETCYDYGIIQKGRNLTVDYFVHAPNMRNGRVSSMASQLKEVSKFLSVAWTRFKEGIGKGFFGQLEINIDLLVDKMPIKGGKNLVWSDVIDLFMMNGISLAKGKRTQYDQNVGRALEILNEGIGSQDFLNAINMCKDLIRDICGVNEMVDGTTPKAGTLVGVMEAANKGTNAALSPYYRGYHSIYKRTSLAKLNHWKSDPDNEAWKREFIVGLEAATTDEEWREYNNNLKELTKGNVDQGFLTASDYMELMWPNMKNLKQAQALCKIRVSRNMKEAQAKAERMAAMNNEQQLAVAKAAEEQKAQTLQIEYTLKKDLKAFETDQDIKLQNVVNQGMIAARHVDAEGRLVVAKQQGSDAIIKHAQISESDQKVQAMKNEMEAMRTALEAKIREVELMLKEKEIANKPKPSAE